MGYQNWNPVYGPNPWNCASSSPSTENQVLAFLLLALSFLSFLPQFVAIFRSKSTEGISYTSVAMGMNASLLHLIYLSFGAWKDNIICCKKMPLTIGDCFLQNLVLIQFCFIPLGFFTLYVFYLLCFSFNDSGPKLKRFKDYKWARRVFGVSFILFVVFAGTAATICQISGASSSAMKIYAIACGIAGSILNLFLWIPQIIRTFKEKDFGSLSQLMLIQLIAVLALTTFFEISTKITPTMWVPNLVSAAELLVLVLMGFYYSLVRGRRDHVEEVKRHLLDGHPSIQGNR